jgi:hypothetical protein
VDETIVFKARRSLGRARVFLAVFGLIMTAGVALMLWGADRIAGAAITAFGALPLLVLLPAFLAPRSRYQIDTRGLLLVKGLSTRRIVFAGISDARVLSETEAETIITGYMAPTMAAETRLDLKGWIESNKQHARLTKFCTVPIVQSKATQGHTLNITAFGAKTDGDFVILRETTGAEFLLSPAEPAAFYQALLDRM